MEKITFCIPSKSNLRYLKTCIPSIRENAYRDDHEIIIFVDSDEDEEYDPAAMKKRASGPTINVKKSGNGGGGGSRW
jgi:glycosyltransferase involved in cell wall biosynthesis